jgi:RNA polymerase sigma factor (sigma-70 family)
VLSWRQTLEALRHGDIVARDRVARLVVGVLQAMRAYQLRDSWDDLVQDVMITLLEHRPDADDDAAVAAYVRSVTARRYFDLLRKEAGRRRGGAEASSGWRRSVPLEEARLDLESAAGLDQRLQIDLERALERIDARRRRILESKYALGCTDAEGAAEVGEALGTYKRLLREALLELRRALISES